MPTMPNIFDESVTLSGKTVGDASHAEMTLIRADSHLGSSTFDNTIRDMSALFEAVLASCDDIHEECILFLRETFELRHSQVSLAKKTAIDKPLEALRYTQALQWASRNISPNSKVTPEKILDVHSRCLYGKGHHQSGARFRRDIYSKSQEKVSESIYPLVNNLCSFINKDIYSPVIQAAIAHYYFEQIQAFELTDARSTAALYHLVFFRRGVVRKTIAPLSLLPKLKPKMHDQLLTSTLFEKSPSEQLLFFNKWVSFYAGAVEMAASSIEVLRTTTKTLNETWQNRLGRYSKGSSLEEILFLLPSNPIVTVNSMMCLTGKGFSATNDAIARLAQAKVLIPSNSVHQRTRVFIAHEVFGIFEKVIKDALPQFLLTSAFRRQILD